MDVSDASNGSVDPEQPRPRHILLIDDADGRRAVALQASTYSLGRDPNNGILLNGSSVSRQHALLIRFPLPDQTFSFRIIDGSADGKPSTNGTRVNGLICYEHDLKHGDEVTFSEEVKAMYYVYPMTDQQVFRYIQSAQVRSIKSDKADPHSTVVLNAYPIKMPVKIRVEETTNNGSKPIAPIVGLVVAGLAFVVVAVGTLVWVAVQRPNTPDPSENSLTLP